MFERESRNSTSIITTSLGQTDEFRSAQVRQLEAQSRMGIYWALVSVILVAFALRNHTSHLGLGLWVIVYLIVQAYRYYLMISFSASLSQGRLISWGRRFSYCTIASGLAWGLAPIFVFPTGSAVHQMYLTIALSGIAAAAAAVYSPLTTCYLPTVLAILVPLSARFFYQGREIDVITGISMLILAAALVMIGRQMNAAFTESLKLRFENRDLLSSVMEQKRIAETLLKEIHHRVKNNLQVICSLLRLQGRHLKAEEARMILKDSETRVRAIAMLHEALYRSKDLERIAVRTYVHDLATQTIDSYKSRWKGIDLKVDIQDLSFAIDTAIPCGLIVHELITNSVKHAFPGDSGGEISIVLHSNSENQIELIVRDNGQGLPQGDEVDNRSESFGLNLVRTFAKQLRGEIRFSVVDGLECRVTFPEESSRTRG